VSAAVLGGVAAALVAAWAGAAFAYRDRIWPVDLHAIGDPVDIGAALATAALLILMAGGVESPARVLLALAFAAFVPGWALLGLIPPLAEVGADGREVGTRPLVDGVAKVALAAALSLTLCVAVTQVLLWMRLWNPTATMGVLGGASLAALVARMAWRP